MCMSHTLSAVTHAYTHTHMRTHTCTHTMRAHTHAHTHMYTYNACTHTCTYTCAHTHSDLQLNIQMVFPLSFSPVIFEGLAYTFSRLSSFLFCICNARIPNFVILNFASIWTHCKYIELRLTQIQLHWNYCKKMYLITIAMYLTELCHIPLASPWPVL